VLNDAEVGVLDYMRLMNDYLNEKINVDEYTASYFKLNKKRVNIRDEAACLIVMQAFGDADDYEPDVTIRRSPWIGEAELRTRVEKSLRELNALGYTSNSG